MTTPAEQGGSVPDRLTRVEVKLDMLLLQTPTLHTDHETRIRRLERAVWLAAGFASAGGGAAGAIISKLVGM